MTCDERIAAALERIANVLETLAEPDQEQVGCLHPDESRMALNGWAGFYCKACDEKVGGPIVRTDVTA